MKTKKTVIISAILLIFSTVAYAGWSGKSNLSNSSSWSSKPDIVSSGNKVYIVWSDGLDIYFKWFDGSQWKSKVKVNSGNYDITDNPQLAIGYGKISIVWEQYVNGQNEIYFRRFNGSSWSTIGNVSQTNGHSSNPKIVSYNNNFYIVWEEDSNKDYTSDEIYYRKFNGSSWTTKQNVSATSSSESEEPAISTDNGKLRVVWTENISGNREIYYRFFAP